MVEIMSAAELPLSVTNHLCCACNNIMRTFSTRMKPVKGKCPQGHPHHNDAISLLEASKLGCYICSHLVLQWENLAERKPQAMYTDARVNSPAISHYGDTALNITLMEGVRPDDDTYVTAEVFVNFAVTTLSSNTFDGPRLSHLDPGSTLDEASLKIARNWLRDCTETHNECTRSLPLHNGGPTRLLKIWEEQSTIRLRLVEQDPSSAIPSYIALSHRWTESQCRTLTTKNISDSLLDISIEDLPKTFKDAAYVALQLKLYYIWIDSLCIIQDSTEDWLKEASAMQIVYQNSALTIAVTNPQFTTHGLSGTRTAEIVDCVITDCQLEADSVVPVTVKVRDGIPYEELIQDTILARRGWCFQERFLSSRILYFGSQQLAWECDHKSACEISPDGISRRPREKEAKGIIDALANRENSRDPPQIPSSDRGSIRSWHHAWQNLVHRYTRCDLTMASDKLVAFSGIAEYFHRKCPDGYLAGLCRDNIVQDLAWSTFDSKGSQIARPGVYRAPSWSWASLDEVISYGSPGAILDIFAEVTSANIELLDALHPFGPIRSAILTINALHLRALWHKKNSEHDGIPTYVCLVLGDSEDATVHQLGDYFWRCNYFYPDYVEDIPTCVSCLILGRMVRKFHGCKDEDYVFGIIVTPTTVERKGVVEPDTFRRVGYFDLLEEDPLVSRALAEAKRSFFKLI